MGDVKDFADFVGVDRDDIVANKSYKETWVDAICAVPIDQLRLQARELGIDDLTRLGARPKAGQLGDKRFKASWIAVLYMQHCACATFGDDDIARIKRELAAK